MTISEVQIGNMALSNIGTRSTIESLTELSTEAININLWYDTARKKTLEAFNWQFAKKRLILASHSEDPPEAQWAFRYQYPSDCLIARELENPTVVNSSVVRGSVNQFVTPDAIPFAIEMDSTGQQKTILTDLESATLIYTFDQNSPELFSPFFVETLSFALASNISIALTGKLSLKERMSQEFLFNIGVAASIDANESVDRPPRDADWIRGRE